MALKECYAPVKSCLKATWLLLTGQRSNTEKIKIKECFEFRKNRAQIERAYLAIGFESESRSLNVSRNP